MKLTKKMLLSVAGAVLLSLAGCSSQASRDSAAKDLWDSSRVAPADYIAKQQALRAKSQAPNGQAGTALQQRSAAPGGSSNGSP